MFLSLSTVMGFRTIPVKPVSSNCFSISTMPVISSCFLFGFVWQWTDLFYTRNFLTTSTRPLFSTELSTIVSRMSRYFSSDASKPIIVPVGRDCTARKLRANASSSRTLPPMVR